MGDGNERRNPVGQCSVFLRKSWLIGDDSNKQSGKGIVRRLAVVLGSASLLLPVAEPVGQRSGAVARTLLAMAATAMATPAQAQTVACAEPNFGTRRRIWTGTVTVERVQEGTSTNLWGYNQSATTPGILSDTDFDIGTNNYTITGIYVADINGDLGFYLQSATGLTDTEVAALKLHVCDTTPYDFSDASALSFGHEETSYGWDLSLDWSSESTRTLYLSLPANNAATGLPAITSSDGATVGDTLTANQGDIADSDGLPATFPDDYTLQWVREDEDGMNGEDISGETSSTYTLTADDLGRKVRVRVSFTDQLSGMETVTSDAFPASGTVVPIPTVTLSGPSSAVEEGNDLTFTLTLDVAAPTDLTVNLTLAETEDVVVATDEGSQTVTVMEGQTQATFTVATRNDDVVEADSVVTVTVMDDGNTPATYEVGSPSEAMVTVSDDDERVVVVSGSPLAVNKGGTGAYRVVLTSQPTGEVTITPSSTNTDVTVSPATLTFTADDWDTAQEVMVSAAADSTDDNAMISHTVMGADYGANNVEAASVVVTVSEVVVSIAAGTSPVGEGTAAVFTLTRRGLTTDALTVDVTVTETGDVLVGTAQTDVTFGANMATATLNVATQDDDVDETDSMVTATVMADGDTPAAYNVGSPSEAMVTVTDNDTRGVVVSGSPLTVNEGGTDTYTVVLTSQPTGEVTIMPSSTNTDVTVSPATLTFTAANWNTEQRVTVTAGQDPDSTDDNAMISHTVTGADYQGITVDSVMVTVSEIALPIVSIAADNSSVTEGMDAVFMLTRTGDDTTNALTVDVTVMETGDVLAGTAPTEVTFGANLSTATLSVATQNDDVDEADSMVTVTVTSDSDTPAMYQVGSPSEAMVTVSDDDEREVVVSGSPLTVNEGGTGAYRVVLTSQPTGEVTITPSSDNTDVAISPTTLTFTPGNWETVQTVTVTAGQDADSTDDNAMISHTVTGADYQDITVDSVMVTVSEIALPSVTMAADNSSVTEGMDAAFTLTRTGAATTEALTVNVTVTQNGEVISGTTPTSVTFDAGSTTATLGISTVNDNVDEDAGTVTATVAPASAAPPTYVLADSASASVAVNDNDPTPVVMLLLSPDTIAEAAGVSEIQAVLSNPSAVETRVTVSIPVEVLDAVELDADPPVLVIPAGMTNSSNVVTLTAVDNTVEAPDLSVTISGMGLNTVGVTAPATVTLTITDDDGTTPMDTTAPRVASIERQTPDASPTNADSLTWRVTFSETVANVDRLDFTVSGTTATITNVEQVSGEPLAHDVTVSGGDLASFNGMVALDFASDQNIADGANNALTITRPTGTNDNSYMVDNTAPTVEITNVPVTSTAPFTATITFNEVVSGFTVDDITVSNNATLSAFTETTPDTVWTVLVTPVADGLVTLEIGADVATDAAGNGNTAAAQVSTYSDSAPVTDTMAPTVEITNVPVTSTAPFTATITFNEVVSGFTVDDITVVNAILSDFTETTTGTVWTVLVTPAADGMVTLEIGAGVAEDAVGNGNTAALQARSNYSAPAMDVEAKEEAEAVLEDVVLPDMIQQLTAETTEVITSRLNTIASGSPLGTPLTLSLDDVVADTVAAFHGQREHLKNGSLDWWQALSGGDFVLPLSSLNLAQGEDASTQEHSFSSLTLWGGGNYSSYHNIIEDTDVDGNGFSGTIGIDLQPIPQLTTGLALTTSRWGLDYATDTNGASTEGTYEIGITMVSPYVNWSATEQLSLWATFGYGRGEVEQDPDGEETLSPRTDSLTSWAGGVRFEVVPAMDPFTGEGAPFGLAFKADGATSSFLDTSVQLARLAAEVSRSFAVEGGLLTAAVELGWSLRSVSDTDDTDGQQQAIAEKNHGGDAELAGRLHWLNVDGSLSATVDTRVLLGGGDHKEWGIGGHFRFMPSQRDGEGLSFTLQPSFGITGTRLEELWSLSGNSDLAINNYLPGTRLDAELAYGFPLGNALLTPYTEVVWEEATNAYGAGLRYGLSSSLELDLKGNRRNRANGNTEHRFSLDLRFDPGRTPPSQAVPH